MLVVFSLAGKLAELAQRAGIGEPIDALAYRELVELMLAGDALCAAHVPGGRTTRLQLLVCFLPRHKVNPINQV